MNKAGGTLVKICVRLGLRGLIVIGKPIIWLVKKIVGFKPTKISFVYVCLSIIILTITLGILTFYYLIIKQLPDLETISQPPALSSKLYDQQGDLLYTFYSQQNRSWIGFAQIPQSLIWATVAIEDKDFYQHPGISAKSIASAIVYNVKNYSNGEIRGGSTITQQLVKNMWLTSEKTWQRKIKEMTLAVLLEWKLNKNQILERYFNQVAYGGEIYGAEEAAEEYFGKHVWELTMAESTFLAGIPAAPSIYAPNANLELAKSRQHQVIEAMVAAGYIDQQKADELKNTPLNLIKKTTTIKAPHFVFYVKDYVEKNISHQPLDKSGLRIVTTLDASIQNQSEKIVADEVKKISNLHITNGAALVMNVKTGGILAMVGSKDYYATDIDGQYNVTTAERQPGSSIKPINYLLALVNGKTLMSTVEDTPVSYSIKGQKPYAPRDYDGNFMGTVTLKTALASSLNIPSVRLLNENGVENMVELGRKMGITTWDDSSRFGLSLALGAGEVRMVDMAQAYSIFANLGNKVTLTPVESVADYQGNSIWSNSKTAEATIDARYAFLINQILSDDTARSPIFGVHSKLYLPGKTVAVKTGTTNSLKDNWTIGWTPSYLVATWVGNNDSSPMSWVASGVTGATPLWQDIMEYLLDDKANESWATPEGVIKATVCGKEEYFVAGTEKNVVCAKPKLTPTPTIQPDL